MSPTKKANPSRLFETPAADPRAAQKHFETKLLLETDASDLREDLQNHVPGLLVVDARSPDSYAAGHIPGARSVHHRTITAESTASWDKSKLYVVYCAGIHCNASTKAAANLSALGFRVKELVDGLEGWKKEGYEVEVSAVPATLQKGR